MTWNICKGNNKNYQKFLNKFKYEKLCTIRVTPLNWCNKYDCHNNVNNFLLKNKNVNKILGYYLIQNENDDILAIQHSIILNNNKLIDITDNDFKKIKFMYGYKLPEYKSIYFNGEYFKTEPSQISNVNEYLI